MTQVSTPYRRWRRPPRGNPSISSRQFAFVDEGGAGERVGVEAGGRRGGGSERSLRQELGGLRHYDAGDMGWSGGPGPFSLFFLRKGPIFYKGPQGLLRSQKLHIQKHFAYVR